MNTMRPPRDYPGMPHDDLMRLIRWQEDNGVTPTKVYRPYADQFESDFYTAVRVEVEASDNLKHHRMDAAPWGSPMVYFADTAGQAGYVVYVGVEHNNDVELSRQRTFMNAWYFYGGPDDELRETLVDSHFVTHDAGSLASIFLLLVRTHRTELDARNQANQ